MDDKLYVIVRSDLPAGAQLAQACHGLRAFVAEHPAVDRAWYETSNNLVALQVPDEHALIALADRAAEDGIPHALFLEPDFDNEATAIALGPTGRRLVSSLPLALRAA